MSTNICYQEILDSYPEYITKEQMYQICHISKRTCLYLLESGIVPCFDSGKKTRRYKIKTADVVEYLRRRQLSPSLFQAPSGYYSEQVLAIAQSLGYRTFNWSFTYRDWELDNQPEHAVALQTMLDGLHSGAIYQLHAISPTNAAILDDFSDAARSIGYEFELLP